jgi:cyanobactin maturation PatA/PatG family protease
MHTIGVRGPRSLRDSLFPQRGDPRICVAILDGPVDLEHPCFRGADLTPLPTSTRERPSDAMVAHGTHVASVIFGQQSSEVEGLAPGCSGLVIPIFCKDGPTVSQLDLARAIELAVDKGAHVINISSGQLTDVGEADIWLHNAIRLCCDRNVLVVAAAGNDGCECLHVPAALTNVLAVGALDRQGQPMEFSNWGEAYSTGGIMAPGEQILGAKPGGGTTRASGTSFATPLVSGAAAFLLSQQAIRGQTPDPLRIRRLLLDTALPCEGSGSQNSSRCLAGKLNLPGAFDALTRSAAMTQQATTNGSTVSPQCECGGAGQLQDERNGVAAAEPEQQPFDLPSAPAPFTSVARKPAGSAGAGNQFPEAAAANKGASGWPIGHSTLGARSSSITPSQSPDEVAEAPGLVYSVGVLGYDFGTEARRDTFKQLMPALDRGTGTPVSDPVPDPLTTFPPNPYDARQMVNYLSGIDNYPGHPSEARSLIWTLNIDLTPVYVIEPVGPFGAEVYKELVSLLANEVLAETEADFVERVSIPGLLTGRNVKLFSGQVVPVIAPQNIRGIYGWNTNTLVTNALQAAGVAAGSSEENDIRQGFGYLLNRIYYDLRNLGKTSQERALNYAATNALQMMEFFKDAVVKGMQLDELSVEKSPFCRMDSDCWDVKLKFFDPTNNQRAKLIFRYTIDVSDLVPVLMGEPRVWTSAN